nr:unnamed protein product [Spirometra erinaceieuropaei]
MYPELVQDPTVHITPYTYYLVCVSTGYFIYDAFDICWNRRFVKEVEVMLHHFAVVSAFMHNVLTMKCIGYSVIALLVEVNTIFLHLRKLMQLNRGLAIETVELLLKSKYDETANRLGHVQVLQLLKFSLRTYFTFDRTIYEQVKSTLMGSPISGFIAEAVHQRLESLVFQHHKPKFWARYVDDTFVVIERDQVLTFQEHLNAVFPDIQFTMEEEENNQLAFLDVLSAQKSDKYDASTELQQQPPNQQQTQL